MRSSMRSWPRLVALGAMVFTLVVSVSGCGLRVGDGNAPTSTPAAVLNVTDAWVRPPQGADRPAGAYAVIHGGAEDDALLSVSSSAAMMVEVHETTTDASGMTGMHPIERLEIPAGETVTLQPGGYHLMLMDVMAGAIEVGKTVELHLTFEKAGEIVVQAEVRSG
jgi:periplasmic copper chaperone A